MEMVYHDGPGVDDPAGFRAGLAQTTQKRLSGPARFKDVPLEISAVEHVVNRTRPFNPKFSRHLKCARSAVSQTGRI